MDPIIAWIIAMAITIFSYGLGPVILSYFTKVEMTKGKLMLFSFVYTFLILVFWGILNFSLLGILTVNAGAAIWWGVIFYFLSKKRMLKVGRLLSAPKGKYTEDSVNKLIHLGDKEIQKSTEIDFEKKFPEVIELKSQLSSILASQRKIDDETEKMRDAISQVKREDIDEAFRSGKVSVADYNKLISDYELWESFVYNHPSVKSSSDKMVKDIEEKIEKLRGEYNKEKGVISDKQNSNEQRAGKKREEKKERKGAPYWAVAILVMLCIVLGLTCVGIWYNTTQTAENWKYKYQEMEDSRNSYRDKYNEAEDRGRTLAEFIDDTLPELLFWETYAVIVTEYGEKYHTYGCQYIAGSNFWIYNIDAAIGYGYTPCSVCNPPSG